jgi:hypothetical protein
MCEALQRMQAVKSFDYDRAYSQAYAGISAIDPRDSEAARELIYGRTLALRVYKAQMRGALNLR